MKRALIALLLCTPAYAGPLANCENGKCWMTEADFKQLQDFHRTARKSSEYMQAHIAEQERAIISMLGKLRACTARQAEKDA